MAKPVKTPAISSKENPSLREIVDRTAVMAKTRRLDISFNELMDMAENGELEIRPEFQRIFVWTEAQQSRFIESLLLELPVPPIYVIEQGEEGHYLLIDGLQRLSTYLHFRGCLTNKYRDVEHGQYLKLESCDIVTQLNGITWDQLDTALQIRLKRSFIIIQVIRKESNNDLKFHMFKRLNAGGASLSPQQSRNAFMRILPNGDQVMDFAESVAKTPDFIATCTSVLSDKHMDGQNDAGFALRFFAFKNARANYIHDVDSFIDDFVEEIAREGASKKTSFDYIKERKHFLKTFEVLNTATADRSFTFPNRDYTELTLGFSVYHFEGVTLGIQPYLEHLDATDSRQMLRLGRALTEARLSSKFKTVSAGGGKNTKRQLDARIAIIGLAVKSMLKL